MAVYLFKSIGKAMEALDSTLGFGNIRYPRYKTIETLNGGGRTCILHEMEETKMCLQKKYFSLTAKRLAANGTSNGYM